MQKSLKAKLQNAVNQVTSFAGADSPALIVGGRRRNRKKRKNKNGQTKRKNRKGEYEFDPDFVITSLTPEFEYYTDVAPRKPLVTCVDLEDPVFIQAPPTPLGETKDKDRDSVYSSSDSLNSSKERHDSGCENELTIPDEINNEASITEDVVKRTRRTHSKDSGVYDDEIDGLDELSDQGIVSDSDTSRRQSLSSVKDGTDITPAEDNECTDVKVEDDDDESPPELVDIDDSEFGGTEQFEEIDLSDDDDFVIDNVGAGGEDHIDSLSEELEAAAVNDKLTENATQPVKIVTSLSQIAEPEKFLTLVDDEDDIIFDLSQLEINNTEDVLSKSEYQKQLNKGSIYDPTELEDEVSYQLPMDLLIDDDKDDEVLYDAGSKKELSITCNPLYEQTLKDEEDRLSLQTFQSGFQTNFDNVNFIQIPTKASHKTSKESSPLLKNRSHNFADDVPCCVIL